MKRKVCKQCKVFVDTGECPICKGTTFSTNWKGRINILSVTDSLIAQKMEIGHNGEYAIKVR